MEGEQIYYVCISFRIDAKDWTKFCDITNEFPCRCFGSPASAPPGLKKRAGDSYQIYYLFDEKKHLDDSLIQLNTLDTVTNVVSGGPVSLADLLSSEQGF